MNTGGDLSQCECICGCVGKAFGKVCLECEKPIVSGKHIN